LPSAMASLVPPPSGTFTIGTLWQRPSPIPCNALHRCLRPVPPGSGASFPPPDPTNFWRGRQLARPTHRDAEVRLGIGGGTSIKSYQPRELGPAGAGVVPVPQVDGLVRDHDQDHRRLDDAPVEGDLALLVAASPAPRLVPQQKPRHRNAELLREPFHPLRQPLRARRRPPHLNARA
jgi:hypothetical protein